MEIAQVVISKQGRDKAMPFIVYAIEDNFLYLVDGDLRKLTKPKKKKIMHVQPTNYVDNGLKEMIINKSYLLDSDIKKAIKRFINKV